MTEGLFMAAGTGQVIARRASISGAQGGCQAEVGTASAMCAAALTSIRGGSNEQILSAGAFAMKSLLGLVCDPVGGLVEYPCQNRNASGAANALIAAEISLSGIRQLIPFDEMLVTMYSVGKKLPSELRETALGGCASAPSACQLCHLMSET